jgi:putative FmdB family regulatory protein
MPTYSYRCTACGVEFDTQQAFSDSPLTTCEACGGTLRKLFSPVGVTFSGSGFYRTDSRKEASSTKTSSSDSTSTASTGGTSTASTSSTPSPTKPSTTTPSTSSPSSS